MARRAGRSGRAAAGLRALVMGALLWGTLPASGAVAAPDVPSYAFADDVRDASAATGTSGAVLLEPGATYKSTLPGGEKAYYRLALDARSTTYVAVTAVPRPGTTPAVGDGVSVSLQDADGGNCSSYDSATIGAARSPQPVTAWAAREIRQGMGLCQKAGTYYVVVERTDTGTDTSDDPWELELAPVSEPPLMTGGATSGPGTWDSATPAPPAGEPVPRPGGTGFTAATAVDQGVWRDQMVPGETVFYKVPVDWGQQVYAEAGVASGGAGKDSATAYVVDALELTLYNPVRAKVEARGIGYGGSQKTASLDPVPPVRYANRYAPADPVNSLRFAGSYYLVVHLAAQLADQFGDGPYEVTLRVRLGGTAQSGPGYAGRPVPSGIFGADAQGAGAGGSTATGDDPVMRAVAVAGIGTGSALLLFLGTWTLAARRRASAQIRANAQNPTA
ncbi:hypothetical protein ACIBVL_12850 [Streptomyces sp. NPDC049687]|uniref:hypothetical protein n=1 Tax=Streptomyces sp. NPDC049687 TaxID=3365596 RepID=UPI0037B2F331